MRLVYALQFRVSQPGGVIAVDLPNLLKADVEEWIAGWYKRRQGVSVSLPATNQAMAPLPLHAVEVAHTMSSSSRAAHHAVTWRYPAESDDRLLWESRCEWATTGGDTEFSFLLRLASREFLVAPPSLELRRPRIVRAIVDKYRCFSGSQELLLLPSRIRIPTLTSLIDAIHDRGRRLPVVLFSVDPYTDKTVADPVEAADKLVGLAHIYVLEDKWASFALTDKLGKPLSCFNGAVRVYWPGFESASDPFDHPIFLPERIKAMQADGRLLANHLLRRLAPVSALRFAYGPITREAAAAVQADRQAEADALREKAEASGDYAELLKLADDELADLKKRNGGLGRRVTELEEELATAKANVATLAMAYDTDLQATPPVAVQEDEQPNTVRDAVNEAAGRFSDTLTFMKSAYDSADESPYGQPTKVLQALEAMDEVCKAWRDCIRQRESMGPFENAFEARGFAYRAKESMTSTGKWADEYIATYDGKRVSIEPHLALGKGGPDTCLRIHFFKDEDKGRFVVAHVGRHKTNTKT